MPPLTTITILVYDLIKVNPTTRALPDLRLRKGWLTWLQNRRTALADKKKSSQQLSDENRHGRHHADSTAKPFCKMETSTGLSRHSASKRVDVEKRGNLRRLWISHLISTGWLVRKHEVMRRPAFYTILLLAWYSDYARFILRVNGWSCWKKATYPQKKTRLLLLLFLYIALL